MNDLEREILTHLHANSATRLDDLAAAVGAPREEVEAEVERLLREGHLERQGERLVPDAAHHATPGLFIASDRTDAESVEVDYGEGDEDLR